MNAANLVPPAASCHGRPPTRSRHVARLTFAIVSGVAAVALHAGAPPAAAADSTIELPPMMVEESISTVPWLYVNAGSAEFLSRCSASTTRQFVETWLAKLQLLQSLVPPEFLARSDVPAVFVLYSQDLEHTVSAEIQRDLRAEPDAPRPGEPPRSRVNIAPNMRLMDRDMHASIAYIDEALFEAAAMNISPNHLRYLLKGRVPELPPWLVEGVERAWRAADLMAEPITLRPLVWINAQESGALARDRQAPRAVLPASELFATGASRPTANEPPRRTAARVSTQELFFRWAVLSGAATRDAFWKLGARAAETPVTEPVFEEIFGFDFAELRDRLSDYLPQAVTDSPRLRPGKLSPPPRVEVERATPNQIARVRGEWERLAIGYVQLRLPSVRDPYLAQARRTLRRAYDAGDRDPRLLATMGLCEVDAGNDPGAREFLEPAVALGVVRPRAYYELARLRWDELRRRTPDTDRFAFAEVAPVLDPLRRGIAQAPPLPEAFVLLADAWARCEMTPNTAEFAEMERGARLFSSRPDVVYPVALALSRHGRKTEAATVLEISDGCAMDENTRLQIAGLRAQLAAATAGDEDN